MRRLIGLILILIVLFVGCAPKTRPTGLGPIPSSGLKDGVYQAEAESFPGWAQVEIIIENGRLTNISILRERVGLGGEAGKVIPSRIVEEQSTDVDAVSGATGSSYIIMEAVQSALDRAQDQ